MLKIDDPLKLRAAIDQLPVPVFVIDQQADTRFWTLRALNICYETQFGLRMKDVAERSLHDFLPERAADILCAHYSKMLRNSSKACCTQPFQTYEDANGWRTAVSHIRLPNGANRITGTTQIAPAAARDPADHAAFENVDYFASTMSMRLGQLDDVLSAIDEGRMPPERLAQSAGLLARLCRSVEDTVNVMRQTAHSRLDTSETTLQHQRIPATGFHTRQTDAMMRSVFPVERAEGGHSGFGFQ